MKHIVSFSGGKDSTAMLLMLNEKGKQIDEILFCDTGKEFPQIYENINKVEQHIGMEITRIKAKKDFDYYMFDHVKTKGKHRGQQGYGWPNPQIRWCTRALKLDVITGYLNKKYKGTDYVEYVGIAYDEYNRYAKNKDRNTSFPLVQWQITEAMALRYCYDSGFDFGGVYNHFDRVSCWCCPLNKMKHLYMLYSFYPELWDRLKDMDSRARNDFKFNCSVQKIEDDFNNIRKGQVFCTQ